MSPKILRLLGVLGLAGSAVWMLLSRSSTGPFLILAGASAAVLLESIYKR